MRLAALAALAVSVSCSGSDGPRNGQIVAYFKGQLYLIEPDGGTRRAVLGTTGGQEPTWSRDGSWIAFAKGRPPEDPSTSDLYLVRPDGSGLRLVARDAMQPTWSPDGRRLAFMRDACADLDCPGIENSFELFVVGVDGRGLQQLTRNADYDGEPAWSPDGREIAFSSADGLFLIRPDGSGRRRLTRGGYHMNSEWSPDGELVAYDTFGDIYVVPRIGGNPRRLTTNPGPDWVPAWSPDGHLIAYLSLHVCARCFAAEDPMQVWLMNADGRSPRRLTEAGYAWPDWGTAP